MDNVIGQGWNPGLTLHADFAARTIGTDNDFTFTDESEAITGGVSFKGSATITNSGDFLIPLNGAFFDKDRTPGDPLTGTIDGAFFGPRAAEIGGVYQYLRAGAVYGAGAFGGTMVP